MLEVFLKYVQACQIEGQLVRGRTPLLDALQDVDRFRDDASLAELQCKLHRPVGGNIEQSLPITGQGRSGCSISGLQIVGRQQEQAVRRLLQIGKNRVGQFQRLLVVALFGFGLRKCEPGREIGRIESEDPSIEGESQFRLSL